jgi:signal transduction histidine kinase
LDFSRRQVPVFGKVDINGLLSDAVKLVGRQKELSKVRIELNYSSEPIIVYGDFNQLKQVFLNMILNAIDATEDGGQIRISTRGTDDDVQIKFEDSGCGIVSENLDKVFEPFFSTKSPGKGTGLGLSICYGIIEEHKGKILVSSGGAGKGVTFTIILPVDTKVQS